MTRSKLDQISDMEEMLIEAKSARDAAGIVDAKADAMYHKLVVLGEWNSVVTAEWVGSGAGRQITGVKDRGTGAIEPTYTYAPIPQGNGQGAVRHHDVATQSQVAYIARLIQERDHGWPTSTVVALMGGINPRTNGVLTKHDASKTITWLKDRPVAQKAAAPVRAGNGWAEWRKAASDLVGHRYATTGDDGTTDFWYISEWKRDDGQTFITLRQVIGGQGNVRVRMSPEAMVTIADKIKAQGIKESMIRFGREIGACGHCGRTLTNEESREAGIGPVCRNSMGW